MELIIGIIVFLLYLIVVLGLAFLAAAWLGQDYKDAEDEEKNRQSIDKY